MAVLSAANARRSRRVLKPSGRGRPYGSVLLAALVLTGAAACSSTEYKPTPVGGLSCPSGHFKGIGADYNGGDPGQPTPENAIASFLTTQHDSLLPTDGYVADPNFTEAIPSDSVAADSSPSPTQLPKLTYVHRSGMRVDVVVSLFQANPGWLVERVSACA
jgi:hypothetical protein